MNGFCLEKIGAVLDRCAEAAFSFDDEESEIELLKENLELQTNVSRLLQEQIVEQMIN